MACWQHVKFYSTGPCGEVPWEAVAGIRSTSKGMSVRKLGQSRESWNKGGMEEGRMGDYKQWVTKCKQAG